MGNETNEASNFQVSVILFRSLVLFLSSITKLSVRKWLSIEQTGARTAWAVRELRGPFLRGSGR